MRFIYMLLGAGIAAFIGIFISNVSSQAPPAQMPFCRTVEGGQECIETTFLTNTPMATLVPPTDTPVPATDTPVPTPTNTPVPTATAQAVTPIPADGIIRAPGTYGGTRDCSAIALWASCVSIDSNDVTLTDFSVNSGGLGVNIVDNHRITVQNGTIVSRNAGVAIWQASTNITVDNIDVTTRSDSTGSSYLIVRDSAPAPAPPCHTVPQVITDITVSNNTFNGGTRAQGHFGLEIKCAIGVSITGNDFKGGDTLVSLPDTDDVLIENNAFDMNEAYWGVEIAAANDVTVRANTFFGDPAEGHGAPATNSCILCGHAVTLNTTPLRTVVDDNTVRDIRTVVDTTGDSITITNNECTNVQRLTEFMHNPPYVEPHVISGNVGCGDGSLK